MIPFRDIYCVNTEDPTSLTELVPGSFMSIYHTDDTRKGLAKPTCVNKQDMLAWFRTRPETVVSLPISEQFSYYVNKRHAIISLRSRAVGLRPLYIDRRRIGSSDEMVHQLIPFIPPNYPPVDEDMDYPYDSINVQSQSRPYYTMVIQRHKLINRIYQQSLDDKTALLGISELDDMEIRVEYVGQPITEKTTLDTLSDPDLTHYKIHPGRHTIVGL